MTKELFVGSMLYLQEMYGRMVTDIVLKQYWERLKNMSDEEWKKAVENLIDTFVPTATVPFPLVPHILQACGADRNTRGVIAVAKVKQAIARYGKYESVDLGDNTLHGVIVAFGGWPAICEWTQKDWDINHQRFIDMYESAVTTGGMERTKLAGLHDMNNGIDSKPSTLVPYHVGDILKLSQKIGGSNGG